MNVDQQKLNFYERFVELNRSTWKSVRTTLEACINATAPIIPLTDLQQLHCFRNLKVFLESDFLASTKFDLVSHSFVECNIFDQIVNPDVWDLLHQLFIWCPNHRKDLVELAKTDETRSGLWVEPTQTYNMEIFTQFTLRNSSSKVTKVPFARVRHCTHDVKGLLDIMKQAEWLVLTTNPSKHYKCNLLWTSAVPAEKFVNQSKSEAFSSDSRYGAFQISFPVSAFAKHLYEKRFPLGTRRFPLENSHTFVMTRSTVRLVDSMTVASNTNLILEDGKTPEGMFTGTEIQILYAQSVFRTEPCIWNYYEDDSSLKNINYPQSVLWDHLEFAVAGPLRLTPADGVQVAIGTHLKFCHKKGGGLFEEDECYSTMERAVENLCKAQNLTWFQARQSFFDPATYSLILAWFNRHEQVPEMDCNVLPETIVSNQ